VYFTLKDSESQIRGVMWRNVASRLRYRPEDGQEVLCCGDIDVYPPRGTYQLIVRQMEPRGMGALQLALRQLQQKLAAEGLFDSRFKRPLPTFPRRIAFVTSPTGAAIQDFLEVTRRRWPGMEVWVIPVRVQGVGAAEEIAHGIRLANRLRVRPDVLVVGRGGGSLEDLFCFNEEPVVRAIFASEIPVVSAVGHEIDVTLSDLVADIRAATPTEAAERLVPSSEELLGRLASQRQRLITALRAKAERSRARWETLAQRRVFRRPLDRVRERMERTDEWEERAGRAIRRRWELAGERLASLVDRLESLSPLAVLARGYSMTVRRDDGSVVRDASSLAIGDRIATRLASGSVVSHIEQIDGNGSVGAETRGRRR
jgi:exodeoxyribonuclease VII large subunit